MASLTTSLWQPAVSYSDQRPCTAQDGALADVEGRILEHNTHKSPVPVPPSVAGPFNAEAAQLTAEKVSLLNAKNSCVVATLRTGGPPPAGLSPTQKANVANGTTAARPQSADPGPVVRTPSGRVTIPSGHPLFPLWKVVRAMDTPMRPYPDIPLQGIPRPPIGYKHPSGYDVVDDGRGNPAVSPDHIVPKVEILYLPRFLELTPENMWEVINAPLNLQWLPRYVNEQLKNSRSAADMKGVDPTWQQQQHELQDRKRRELTILIGELADTQIPAN